MFVWLLVIIIISGLPLLSFAQFVDAGEYVEVLRGTKLCSNVILGKFEGDACPRERLLASPQ